MADTLHVRGGGRRPVDAHLGAEHFFEAGVHLFLFDELAAIGVGFGFHDGGAKTRVLIDHGGVLLYDGLWIDPNSGSDFSLSALPVPA